MCGARYFGFSFEDSVNGDITLRVGLPAPVRATPRRSSLGRIEAAALDPAVLLDLCVVEQRLRPPCESRLRTLATPRLHRLARAGDAERIVRDDGCDHCPRVRIQGA